MVTIDSTNTQALKELQEMSKRPRCIICMEEDNLVDFKSKKVCQDCVETVLGME